jgi:hypothetical protein
MKNVFNVQWFSNCYIWTDIQTCQFRCEHVMIGSYAYDAAQFKCDSGGIAPCILIRSKHSCYFMCHLLQHL